MAGLSAAGLYIIGGGIAIVVIFVIALINIAMTYRDLKREEPNLRMRERQWAQDKKRKRYERGQRIAHLKAEQKMLAERRLPRS